MPNQANLRAWGTRSKSCGETCGLFSNITTVDALPSVVLVFTLRAEREKVMTHIQRSGYMLLGAGLLALGIIIGRMIETRTVVQSGGVFDEIVCRRVTLVDKDGNKAMDLGSSDDATDVFSNELSFYDKWGNLAMLLYARDSSHGIWVYDDRGNRAFELSTNHDVANRLLLRDKKGSRAVTMVSSSLGNLVNVHSSLDKSYVSLYAWNDKETRVAVRDKGGKTRWQAP